MKTVLHIQVVVDFHQIPFDTEVHQLIRTEFPEVDFFGLDSHSTPQMIGYAQSLIEQSAQALIIVDCQSDEAPLGKLIRLFNKLNREKPKHVSVISLGRHPMVEKMVKPLGDQFMQERSMQQIKSMASAFLA